MGQIDFDGSNSTVKADIIRGQTGTTVKLGGLLDTDGNYIQTEKGGDLTSASPLVIDTDGSYFDVTGTTNFAAMTVAADRQFTLQFDGALTMTHHATNLDLPGEANITTAAGDVATFQSTGSNTVQCINYTRADGSGIAGGGDFSDGGEVGGANRSIGNTDAYDMSIETNNVAQLIIEGSATGTGILSLPNQSAYGGEASGVETIVTGTHTKVSLDTEFYDNQNEFDSTTNYRFTVTIAGTYLLLGKVNWQDPVDISRLDVKFRKNGADWSRLPTMSSGTGQHSITVHAIEDLDANDYIELWVYHTTGVDETITRNDSRDKAMWIHRLS
jgi:hypothetical protein